MSCASPGILGAAKVTVGFATVYGFAMVHQIVTKQLLARRKRRSGEPFNRYSAPELLNSDRLVANLLEWAPIFLLPLWSLAAVDKLDELCLKIAWAYVGLRGVYLCLVVKYGVAKSGLNTSLWTATFPAYYCVTFLWKRSLEILYL